MPSAALLLRLSTFLLVPILALSGLGTSATDPALDMDSRAVARAGALADASARSIEPAQAPDAAEGAPDGESPSRAMIAAAEAKNRGPEDTATAQNAPEGKGKAQAAPEKDQGKNKNKGQNKNAAKAKASDRAAAAAAPAKVKTRTLYLGVGHGRAPGGGWQPGAQDPRSGTVEVDAAQIMVDAMAKVINDAPGVELTVESGDHPNVVGSTAAANAAGVDDCIEIHQDTAAAPPGAFGHWYTDAHDAHRLANRLVNSVHDRGVPIRTDWHRERPGLYWVSKTTCRSVLMEVGRVGDFSPGKLRQLGRGMGHAYLQETAEARGVASP